MKFRAGTMLGAYEILGPLGAGGMGEVYRARDSRLKREVAIKVLPEASALDPEHIARFQREAEVLASLNHRHIAAIHDFAQIGDSRLLVMELVDGDTLADRIARGPIPIDEALGIAKQIAEALEAAHEKGIVHRDLKPANVKLSPGGEVKVLDFGLAKVREAERSADLSHSPTKLTISSLGVIMGTAGYMSPEQAKGVTADARSDIWAFGVLLHEMLTGKPVFAGGTIAEVLSGVLKSEPDWSALPGTTPPLLRSLIRRCLRKDRSERLRDIADVRIEIEELLGEPSDAPEVAKLPGGRREGIWRIVALIALAAAVIAVAGSYFRVPAPSPEVRLMVVTPPGEGLTSFALSPDGRHVVFQATTAGKTQLWLRPLASDTPQPMQGTDGGTFPFWSPDSRSIGFFADQKLKRIDVDGAIAQELAEARYAVGGTWNRDGVILFGPSTTGPLYRVPAEGGKPVGVTQVNPPLQTSHRFPFFLPDARHFLFFIAGTEGQGLYVGSLDQSEAPKRLFNDVVMAVFAPPDNLVFLRQGRLFQQRLDMGALVLLGNPVSIAASVVSTSSSRLLAEGAISVSETGLLAYRTTVTEPRQLVWFDRSGKQTGALGEKDVAGGALRLSPDGQTVALERSVNRQGDLWLMETARGVLTRFTTDGANNGKPVWSPDGKQVAFVSRRSGRQSIYVGKAAGAVLSEKALIETSENNIPDDWSPDGGLILYERENSATGLDLWTVDLKTGMSFPAVEQTSYNEAEGRFSPNGQWIVYQSNESGRPEIYVVPFPPGQAGKKQVSTDGGLNPQWNHNGREVFYMGLDDRLMSAGVVLQANGSRVEVKVPQALFANRPGSLFDVASDGEHFLVNTFIQDVTTPPITVILNWGK